MVLRQRLAIYLASTALLAVMGLTFPQAASAFSYSGGASGGSGLNVLPKLFQKVGIDQKLNAKLPMNAVFKDEYGHTVKLGDYFDGKTPVLLLLVQFSCPNLCTEELNGLVRAINTCLLQPGKDYKVLTVSFDPTETPKDALAKKDMLVAQVHKPGIAKSWHFLTGTPASIKILTNTVGFRYVYDAARKQYIHSGALMIVTPKGRMSKYLYGASYSPNSLRICVAEAGQSQIGSLSNAILLFCCRVDPVTGKYNLAIAKLLKVAAVITIAGFGLFFGIQYWQRKAA